tara:strand:+ start:555 stop:746 length:192 start_codon:yes stop_codon:yes gene_type:complete
MATFAAYYSIELCGSLRFEADSLEQAEELVYQVPERMSIEDLPSVRIKQGGTEVCVDGIERVD